MRLTFRQVIEKLGGVRTFTQEMSNGQSLEAFCWTDDPEMLDMPATFDIRGSWGEIGRYDNLNGELDIDIMCLADKIRAAIPEIGQLVYNPPDGLLEQKDA